MRRQGGSPKARRRTRSPRRPRAKRPTCALRALAPLGLLLSTSAGCTPPDRPAPSLQPGFLELPTGLTLEALVPPDALRFPSHLTALTGDVLGDGQRYVLLNGVYRTLALFRYRDASLEAVPVPSSLQGNVRGLIDLDNDGLVDLLGESNQRAIAWGTAPGEFANYTSFAPLSSGTQSVVQLGFLLQDFDADGWLDLAVAENPEQNRCAPSSRPVALYLRVGPRDFADYRALVPTSVPSGEGVLLAGELGGQRFFAMVNSDCEASSPRVFSWQRSADTSLPSFTPRSTTVWNSRLLPGFVSAPMGASIGDLNEDGYPDLLLSDNPRLWLWYGTSSGALEDRTETAGITYVRGELANAIPWSVLMLDLDLDGAQDLVVTYGDDATTWSEHRIGLQRPTAFWNARSGRFPRFPGLGALASQGNWRGLVATDLDRDGRPDLLVSGLNHVPMVLLNRIESTNHGLGIVLHGTSSNHLGIGARLRIESEQGLQTRTVGSYFPFEIVPAPSTFVGLGASTRANVTIQWPSGTTQQLDGLAADQLHDVTEPPVFSVLPASRHLPADGVANARIHLTPRAPGGALLLDATVQARVLSGGALIASVQLNADGSRDVLVRAPTQRGSSPIELTINGATLPLAPRLFWD